MTENDPLAHVDTGRVPERINVAVNPTEVAALERIILVERVSLTEAVRRLIGYGDHLHREVVDRDARVFARYPDGREHELVLVRDDAEATR